MSLSIGDEIQAAMKNGVQKVVMANVEVISRVLLDSGFYTNRKDCNRVANNLMNSALFEIIQERTKE